MSNLVFWTLPIWHKIVAHVKHELQLARDEQRSPGKYAYSPRIIVNQRTKVKEFAKANDRLHGYFDREEEHLLGIKLKPLFGNFKYEYYDIGGIDDLEIPMIEQAKVVKATSDNSGKIIDCLWSGGLDSTGALLALAMVCDPQQIRVLMTESSIEENPNFYKDQIEGKLPHRINKTRSILSDIKANENITITCTDADGIQGGMSFDGVPPWEIPPTVRENPEFYLSEEGAEKIEQVYKVFLRYRLQGICFRLYRMTEGIVLPIENIVPFYTGELIQKFFINRAIEGKLVYYPPFEGYEYYDKSKMDLRNFIAKLTGDKDWAYSKPKINSWARGQAGAASGKDDETLRSNPRILGLTDEGLIIHKDNIDKIDYSDFIDFKALERLRNEYT